MGIPTAYSSLHAKRIIVFLIAAFGIASAQPPTPDQLDGVWVLDASRSRIPPGSASAPSALEFVKTGSDVKTVQVWFGNGGRRIAVMDYRVDPPDRDGVPGQTFRARDTTAGRSSVDEQWSLSGDGGELVIRRMVDGGPQADVQILYYKRSTEISRLMTGQPI